MNRILFYAMLSGWMLLATVSLGAGELRRGETDPDDRDTTLEADLKDEADLSDYLRYAALNNPGLKAAFHEWKAALERIPQVRSLPDPRFNYAYFIEEVETRVGPQHQKFGLTQAFPWFGTLGLREDAAGAAAAAVRAAYDKEKLKLFQQVKSAYHEYWYLGRAIEVTREHVRLVSSLEAVARARFKTGTVPHSAVIQAQVEQGKLEDRLRSLEALRRPVAARLNAALNRPLHTPVPWPRALPVCDVVFTDEEAEAWQAEYSPDLQRLEHQAKQAQADIALARKSYYPDIMLGVDYVDTDDAAGAGVADSGKDPVLAMVSVSLPLWYGKQRAAGREARQRKAAVEARRADTANRLQADLALALYRFRDAGRKLALYGDTLVPQAEQSVEVARQGFESGETPFASLIDAQRLLLEFQLARQRARADRGQRLAEIEVLVGREIGDQRSEVESRRSEVREGEER